MGFFRKKKRTIFERFSEHASKVLEAVKLADEAVDAYFNKKDVQKIAEKIFAAETEADRISYDIARDLFRGQLLPYTSEDWFELLNNVDNLADFSDRIAKFLLVYRVNVKQSLKHKIDELMALSLECAATVKDAVELMRTDMESAAEKAGDVARIRHRARDLEYGLFSELFHANVPVKKILLLKEIIYWITQVSNASKRAASRIIMMGVKYSF